MHSSSDRTPAPSTHKHGAPSHHGLSHSHTLHVAPLTDTHTLPTSAASDA
eukprot:XP_001692374.1 predicted protein [Chlamydomonas reinhardtii]